MADDFIDAEAIINENKVKLDELSDAEQEKATSDEDKVHEQELREELEDLQIDGNSTEEENSSRNSESDSSRKRRKSVQELDDRFEDEDYDLIEENLGIKVKRKKFKRLRCVDDDDDDENNREDDREAIANELFTGDSDHDPDAEDEHQQERALLEEDYDYEEEMSDSDPDDFIVDEEGRPVTERRKKKREPVYDNALLQIARDIFGRTDFDFDEDSDNYEEDENDYIDDSDEERPRKSKNVKKSKEVRKSIFEVYEPCELRRGHYTDLDNQIRNKDIPERMQLRNIPITPVPEDSNELKEEAEWIYRQAFCKPTITTQLCEGGVDPRTVTNKGDSTIGKIEKALDFMRNQYLEVPFIACYRKEYVLPELDINDLWNVYKYDAMWCGLKARKSALLELFERIRVDHQRFYTWDIHHSDHRFLGDEDVLQLQSVQTSEELNDVHARFLLYYGHLVPKMRERVESQRQQDEQIEQLPGEEDNEVIKPACRGGPYAICRKAKLDGFANRFGLRPEQFAENFRDNCKTHDIEQELIFPYDLAAKYCGNLLKTPFEVLKAVKVMVAAQLSREPLVRKVLRDAFFERARINVAPTKKGFDEIDENHQCFTVKYLKGKPVRALAGFEFLLLHIAEQDKLLKISFDEDVEGRTSSRSCLEEMKAVYTKEGFSCLVQEWNELRLDCVELAYREMLLPSILKELRAQLLAEAKECVLQSCSHKLYNWLNVAGYSVDFEDEVDDDWSTSKGLRIMGVAYSTDFQQAPFACIVDSCGECIDYKKLSNLLKRKNSYREDERLAKEKDLCELRDFISKKKPHAICVSAESREALFIVADLEIIVKQLVQDEQFPLIPVEILDNNLAKIYANSIKGNNDFPDYPLLLREAISLARRLQDPLVEFSQLCTSDDEILCLRYHSLQEYVPVEDLLEVITREFVNKTNEVGVDVNRVVRNVYSRNLLQYVSGLGLRKAAAIIKLLQQTSKTLENRVMLVTRCHMGPVVFTNCAGFIKIDTNALDDDTDTYIEVLDGSRVHPEMYEWARKMAEDALDNDETNQAQALDEILNSPERLNDLDLDAFAEELKRQDVGDKSITLYDIRAELHHRYKDQRTPYQSPDEGELFVLLTKETPESFHVGKMVQATVVEIRRKKPETEQLDQANPVRKDETGLWQCPICLQDDFAELSEVWSHFDIGDCPGQATGVRIRLENGLRGHIDLRNLSDEYVGHPEERVCLGQMIHCRITEICLDTFSVQASSKSSDLNDADNNWRRPKDQFYDYSAEERDREMEKKKREMRTVVHAYTKRMITHPSFKNCTDKQAMVLVKSLEQGECLIRPSSGSADQITLTWKVAEKIFQHVRIVEKDKKNAFSLGQSLLIGNKEFEDLDEIITSYIYPMAAWARDLLNYKYYQDTDGGKLERAEEIIRAEKSKNPDKIHYIFSACADHPGRFLLSYEFRHEYVMVTPEGYRFRDRIFDTVDRLLNWFKQHFTDPIPGIPPDANNIPRSLVNPAPVPLMNTVTTPYTHQIPHHEHNVAPADHTADAEPSNSADGDKIAAES